MCAGWNRAVWTVVVAWCRGWEQRPGQLRASLNGVAREPAWASTVCCHSNLFFYILVSKVGSREDAAALPLFTNLRHRVPLSGRIPDSQILGSRSSPPQTRATPALSRRFGTYYFVGVMVVWMLSLIVSMKHLHLHKLRSKNTLGAIKGLEVCIHFTTP